MIEQRKRNLPSINFESNEDSLDGFDLAEFEPRQAKNKYNLIINFVKNLI